MYRIKIPNAATAVGVQAIEHTKFPTPDTPDTPTTKHPQPQMPNKEPIVHCCGRKVKEETVDATVTLKTTKLKITVCSGCFERLENMYGVDNVTGMR